MGSVFAAEHVEQGVSIAIKVVSADYATNSLYLESFGSEVRAVASLDHPGIVKLFDYGVIDAAAARCSAGQLTAGSPYLAMEWVSGGSMQKQRPGTWPALKRVLIDLLDALAHAHARGVVHRDIKPSNVMRVADRNSPTRIKLTDFGIAHIFGDDMVMAPSSQTGTPQYMAPEQVEGAGRKHGPWTDLYALGCLAYRFASGAPPFYEKGISMAEVLRRQIEERIPSLQSRLPVPTGFSDWLAELLHKSPQFRFQRAADAKAALLALPEPVEDEGWGPAIADPVPPEADEPEQPTRMASRAADVAVEPAQSPSAPPTALSMPAISLEETELEAPTQISSPSALRSIEGSRVTAASKEAGPVPRKSLSAPQARAVFPDNWRRIERLSSVNDLLGAGLGLYGLRPIPMVDRAPERDTLWAAMGAVIREGSPRVVSLCGPAGVGKSRLARWLAHRVHENGGATILTATHGRRPSPSDGLAPMLARALRTHGLDRAEALEHTLSLLHSVDGAFEDALSIVEFTHPFSAGPESSGARVILGSARERHLAVRLGLSLLSKERPLLLWVDDAQRGHEALEFISYLMSLEDERTLPVLVVLTHRRQVLADHPLEHGLLADLNASGAESTDITALGPRYHRELVSRLLGLSGDLADEVAQRTQGNPLFAIELVGDWVKHGLLMVGAGGFRLRPGATPTIPDGLHGLWAQAFAEITESYGLEGILATEIAAVLGEHFDPDEWGRACAAATIGIPAGLDEELLNRGLAQVGEAGRHFAHGMLVESLRRHAEEEGRIQGHEAACALALQHQYEEQRAGVAERLAHHLEAAGDFEAALPVLLRAADEHVEASRYQAALALLEHREALLDTLQSADDDLRRAQGWMKRALLFARLGRPRDSSALVERVFDVAKDQNDRALLAQAILGRAKSAQMEGSTSAAIPSFEEALTHFRQLQDPRGMARCEHGMAEMYQQSGRRGEAIGLFDRALAHFKEVDDEAGRASCLAGFVNVLRDRDPERAALLLEEARALNEARGYRVGLAIAVLDQAVAARDGGDYSRARTKFRDARRLLAEIESSDAFVPENHLALLDMLEGRYEEAALVFERHLEQLRADGRSGYLVFLYVELLPCRAVAGRWKEFDTLCADAEATLKESGLVDGDLLKIARLAGNLAAAAGEKQRAAAAHAIADQQEAAIEADN